MVTFGPVGSLPCVQRSVATWLLACVADRRSDRRRYRCCTSRGVSIVRVSPAVPELARLVMEFWRYYPHDRRYAVSSTGKVMSSTGWRDHDAWHELAQVPSCDGHLYVKIGTPVARIAVHRVMLEAFAGPRLKGQVGRHLNDVPTDNRIENLAWGTRGDNVRDAIRNGRKYGRPGVGRKLSKDDVLAIASSATPAEEVAAAHGISTALVYHIRNGTAWTSVTGLSKKGRGKGWHATQTHCAQGHEFTTENTRVRPHGRECRACAREQARRRREGLVSHY